MTIQEKEEKIETTMQIVECSKEQAMIILEEIERQKGIARQEGIKFALEEVAKVINKMIQEFKELGRYDEDDKNTYHTLKELKQELGIK